MSSGFLGSSDPSIHFGLGQQSILEVKVKWSTGYIQSVEGVEVNSVLIIEEELPPDVIDYSTYLLAIMAIGLILLIWNSRPQNQ